VARATDAHATIAVVTIPEPLPDEIDALKAALAAERTARQEADARHPAPRRWWRI